MKLVLVATTILGVTLDRGLAFRQHVQNVANGAKTRLNVLRAVATTTFGHSKEYVTALYKQFILHVLEHVGTACTPNLATTNFHTLQRTQNTALSIATGCCRSTPSITFTLTQYFARTVDPAHPSHYPLTNSATDTHDPGDTLQYVTMECAVTTEERLYRKIVTTFTRQAMEAVPFNCIFQSHPTKINPSQESFPRPDRASMARLRCGHPNLRIYPCGIGRGGNDLCSQCLGNPDTVDHVLERCPSLASESEALGVDSCRDMWSHPSDVLRIAVLQTKNHLTVPSNTFSFHLYVGSSSSTQQEGLYYYYPL